MFHAVLLDGERVGAFLHIFSHQYSRIIEPHLGNLQTKLHYIIARWQLAFQFLSYTKLFHGHYILDDCLSSYLATITYKSDQLLKTGQ